MVGKWNSTGENKPQIANVAEEKKRLRCKRVEIELHMITHRIAEELLNLMQGTSQRSLRGSLHSFHPSYLA